MLSPRPLVRNLTVHFVVYLDGQHSVILLDISMSRQSLRQLAIAYAAIYIVVSLLISFVVTLVIHLVVYLVVYLIAYLVVYLARSKFSPSSSRHLLSILFASLVSRRSSCCLSLSVNLLCCQLRRTYRCSFCCQYLSSRPISRSIWLLPWQIRRKGRRLQAVHNWKSIVSRVWSMFQYDIAVYWVSLWVHGFVFNRRDLETVQHHEPSTMKGPLWWKGRDVVEDSSVFDYFL